MKKLLGMLLIGCAALMSGASAADEPVKAINFKFTDISGKTIQLSDFKGKWVLVNFWAPWCPLCWVEVPTLNELNKRRDFVVIGVGLDYGPDEGVVRDTASRHNLDFHAVVAGGARRNQDSPFRQVGPVDFYPTSYIYDPNGEIVMFIPGQVRLNRVLAFMDDYKKKVTTQYAADSDRGSTSPIQEVTFGAPASSAPRVAPAAKKGPRTVTY
ncbi:MAG: TlpA disulfide reductase family protein [Pseudomonadota bacterium]|nr:TlpA disulfide reductase family protein [Pseudomonadota bacterium]MDP1905643.1 TlpA disulfide reductase family protein [Pseudomonadota bacterium]MDP2353296.1 TlpA disulfide reductase family protein [Pseudomonadota bacterium]